MVPLRGMLSTIQDDELQALQRQRLDAFRGVRMGRRQVDLEEASGSSNRRRTLAITWPQGALSEGETLRRRLRWMAVLADQCLCLGRWRTPKQAFHT